MKKITLVLICLLFSTASTAKERKVVPEKLKSELIKVFSVNEQLHKAFFEYEKQKGNIPSIATQLSDSIDGISDPDIKKLLKFSQGKLKEIKEDAPKEDNNQRYHLVSMALIHILQKYNIGADYNAYSCPMVKKKWIQNSKKMAKVHNPYAPEMPHCGSQDTKL